MFKIVIQDEDIGAKALGCLRIYLQKYSNAKARKCVFEAITIRGNVKASYLKNKQKCADKVSTNQYSIKGDYPYRLDLVAMRS